ncbi:MAG: hypothetical protein AB7O24_32735 [Kofleriaceae bacterium]
MAIDHRKLVHVAWGAAIAGCSPSFRPPAPPPEPGPVVVGKPQQPRPSSGGGRQVLVGEMCPQGAAGRPAVAPLMMRTHQWSDAASDLSNTIERGSVPRFVVYGVDGKPAGAFDTVGLAAIGVAQSVAAGTYMGAPPCTSDAGKGARTDQPQCTAATHGCGLAVAELRRPDDDVDTPAFTTGGACLSGDAIAVDIDRDGVIESFPLAGVLDGIRSPSAEWSAAPTAGAVCKPQFQLYDIKLVRAAEPGKPVDTKSLVVLDVLGVLDLDGDGRDELVIALRFPTVRTILVYTASGSAQRLEIAGEGESFPR